MIAIVPLMIGGQAIEPNHLHCVKPLREALTESKMRCTATIADC
ncbi:hypothetical protein [Phormidesmis sp. 146-33]